MRGVFWGKWLQKGHARILFSRCAHPHEYLSRNACHTSLVESNGARRPDVSSFCYARGVISFFHREPPREATGKKEHRQSGARFVSTVSDSTRPAS